MEHRPMPGELYRHFKDKLYQIITVAKHSETGEELVIYQALYGDYAVYARPLAMFMSEVDRKKYPGVRQRYRFERVRVPEPVEKEMKSAEESGTENVAVSAAPAAKRQWKYLSGSTDSESGVHPGIMAFLETNSFEERCNILVAMRDSITDSMIDTMAVAMDEVIPAGALQKRYDDLMYVLRTKLQYETAKRLRG